MIGKAQLRSGNIEEAIINLRKSIEAKKERNRAYIYLAEGLMLNNQISEAYDTLIRFRTFMANLDYNSEAKRMMIYIYDLKNEYPDAFARIKTISPTLPKEFEVYDAYLDERNRLYMGNKEEKPLGEIGKYAKSTEFWRWRIAREMLLMDKKLSEILQQLPQEQREDNALYIIEAIANGVYVPELLQTFEKLAKGNIDDYMYLPALYLIISEENMRKHDYKNAVYYAEKALYARAIGFLKMKAEKIINRRDVKYKR